jgi:hypothetical protein
MKNFINIGQLTDISMTTDDIQSGTIKEDPEGEVTVALKMREIRMGGGTLFFDAQKIE